MHEHHIAFHYKARYFQAGDLKPGTENVIFAFHGYGQQARYFLKKFQHLGNDKTCIIAPEGLSRFYLQGFDGRVGATWMTKEDRLSDIGNYLSYLNALYTTVSGSISDKCRISLLGFSQGAATASRWAVDGVIRFDQLILWAGIFPADMNIGAASQVLAGKDIHYIYGLKDPYISAERLNEMQQVSDCLGVTPSITTFQGDHNLDSATLRKLFVDDG